MTVVVDNNRKCNCNKKCLITHHMTINSFVYSCAGIQDKKVKRNKIYVPDVNTFFCEFKEVELVGPVDDNDYIPKKKNKVKIIKDKDKIKPIMNSFLSTKKYILFQEIELLCKNNDISIYDPEIETMYEFTQRVLQEFELK